jgi:hypothetical protein
MTRTTRPFLALCAFLAASAGPLRASDNAGYSLTVLVDGAATPEYAARRRVYVEALKGKEFVLRISNPTNRRVAVALSVDGRNVIDAKRSTSGDAAKWVLGPWETIDVPGWQVSGATSRRFFFTETSRSYANWLGDTANVGTIEAVFYRERMRDPRPAERRWKDEPLAREGAPSRDEASRDDGQRSPAGAPPTAQSPSGSKTKKAEDSYAATGIGNATEFPVEWVAFEAESSPAARIALRYEFRAELVRLGVLPREEELFARDRAHGFEHDYAPDPYRR